MYGIFYLYGTEVVYVSNSFVSTKKGPDLPEVVLL